MTIVIQSAPIVFLLAFSPLLVGDELPVSNGPPSRPLNVILAESVEARDVRRIVRDTFDPLASDDVRHFASNPNHSIAILAAWELVRRDMRLKDMADNIDKSVPRGLSSTRLARFIGFLEGRLGIAVPHWWEAAVMDASYLDENTLVINSRWNSDDRHFGVTKSGLRLKKEFSIDAKDGVVSLSRAESERLVIPDGIIDYVRAAAREMVVVAGITDADWYFGHTYPAMTQYKLFRISRAGKKIWETDIVVGEPPIVVNPPGSFHWVEIIVDRGRVLLFGVSTFGAYVEVLSEEDGLPLIRFSTTY